MIRPASVAPWRESVGVRANCVCPGLVDTPSSRRSWERLTPIQRAELPPALTPADMGDAAMRFLADDSCNATGLDSVSHQGPL